MPDTFADFAALARQQRSGIDYRVLARRAAPPFAIMAPHGGGIEAGTSEIADAVAGTRFSFHTLEGLKKDGNSVLHITSTRFDEPMCLIMLGHSAIVITIHGEESEAAGERVFVGGLDVGLGAAIEAALTQAGFNAREHPEPGLQGREPANLCNRGTSQAGVQLELSKAVRRSMFQSLLPEGRQHPTAKFHLFVEALAGALTAAADTR
jgi:phage replication-related protein YjqB (UPF0714/DUF867 family)